MLYVIEKTVMFYLNTYSFLNVTPNTSQRAEPDLRPVL